MANKRYNICTSKKVRASDEKVFFHKVGVAFQNDKGQLSIKLNPGTVLDWRLGETYHITLFPAENRTSKAPPSPVADDDIPF